MKHRVDTLADDFERLDEWRVPVEASAEDPTAFSQYIRVLLSNGFETDSRIASALFSLRLKIGRALGWDGRSAPIPDAKEHSIVERLTEEDLRRNRADRFALGESLREEVTVVYVFESEALLEVSNKTVHALIHTYLSDEGDRAVPRVAIYIKSRGLLTRAYMAAIKPFRYLIIYPAWMARLKRKFYQAGNAQSAST